MKILMKPALAFIATIMIASGAFAQELAGEYRVEGSNPGGQGSYSGSAAIFESGETYQVAWKIAGQEYRGTGILFGDTFSVVYQPGQGAPGIAVYEVGADGSLSGVWTTMQGQAIGEERWQPAGAL